MRKDQLIAQAHLADLTDEQLLDLVGALWENVKRLDEQMRSDPRVERLENELKEVKAEFTDDLKLLKAKLKAARMMAKAKGLAFEAPEIK